MEIVRLDTDGNITRHEYPAGGYKEVHSALTGLIGEKCELLEPVRPNYLYTGFGGVVEPSREMVIMLVDESGYYHDLNINMKASYLYGAHKHGQPILGNVLFIGEMDYPDKDFTGLTKDMADNLEAFLKSFRTN